ncbi:hypothetical protein JCM11641_003026 [Rhodosporidiobolus odoratus]
MEHALFSAHRRGQPEPLTWESSLARQEASSLFGIGGSASWASGSQLGKGTGEEPGGKAATVPEQFLPTQPTAYNYSWSPPAATRTVSGHPFPSFDEPTTQYSPHQPAFYAHPTLPPCTSSTLAHPTTVPQLLPTANSECGRFASSSFSTDSAFSALDGVSPAELHASSGTSAQSVLPEMNGPIFAFASAATSPMLSWHVFVLLAASRAKLTHTHTRRAVPASVAPLATPEPSWTSEPAVPPQHRPLDHGYTAVLLPGDPLHTTVLDSGLSYYVSPPPRDRVMLPLHDGTPFFQPPGNKAGHLPSPPYAFTALSFGHSAPQSEHSSLDAAVPGQPHACDLSDLRYGGCGPSFSAPLLPFLPAPAFASGALLDSLNQASSTVEQPTGLDDECEAVQPQVEKVNAFPADRFSRRRRQASVKVSEALGRVSTYPEIDETGGTEGAGEDVLGSHPVVLRDSPEDGDDYVPSTPPSQPGSAIVSSPKSHQRNSSTASSTSTKSTLSSSASLPSTGKARPCLYKVKKPDADVSDVHDSQSEFFGAFEQSCVVLKEEEGKIIKLNPSISNPSSFTYDTSIPCWRTYRRNFLSLPVSLSLPASPALANLHTATTTSLINRIEVSLSAASLPKGANVELLQFDASRSLRQAKSLQRQRLEALSTAATGSVDTTTNTLYSTTFSRIQYRHSTSNHPSSSASAEDARFVMKCELVAVHEDGSESTLGGWKSAKLVVRGRSPGNFSKVGKGGKKVTAGKKRKAPPQEEDEDEKGDASSGEEGSRRGVSSAKRRKVPSKSLEAATSASSPSSLAFPPRLDSGGRTRASAARLTSK